MANRAISFDKHLCDFKCRNSRDYTEAIDFDYVKSVMEIDNVKIHR